ncbi:ribosome small subunit-dependent GTPase A [Amnibacterium sp. CER49]|uniref:ribosome small subunit-dependent GTPase A n=1 Tax=Amnibacterium sp. CER49 TaxID=3039161 RepID=UPI0024470007|nr:ribosome small subunit-dependent GTPase A [Amnibacterium sp. CER49]MDH2445263.1 ribosome small subunit-dependent GTPase A [Amnibacterium sp. CER49]
MSWLSEEDEPYEEYDEAAARVRPNRRGSRPRSKQRPAHETAVPGRVLTVDRGRMQVLLGEGDDEREVQATRARELGRTGVVTGDRVDVVGDLSGQPGTLARIVRLEPRTTVLRRSADDTDEVERVVVANADQLLIVVAAANPEPRPALIDRYLVAAFDAGIDPLLLVTKTDLADPAPLLDEFVPLDLPVVLTQRGADLGDLRRHLLGRTTVAVGHSGVGKSTLVNALVPDAGRATGAVNEVTGRGRHTSSSSVALRVLATEDDGAAGRPPAGWIIDTPGIRSFGLGHIDPASILRSFAARSRPVADPPDGIALADAHDWEIVDRVGAGELGEAGKRRLESLQRLLEAQGGRITGADEIADGDADEP